MLIHDLKTKRCIMVCGGGGVGKTTVAASIAIAAARLRPRVLVVTIDPAKRLLQAFGFENAFTQEGGAPLELSSEVKAELGLPETASLSVALLNPKYVLDQVLAQTLTPVQEDTLKKTVLFRELSQMIYGLQEYTAYEWVTRMLGNQEYDLIVLDTPPALHAKDFFNAPDKIKHLMESRVFQIFLPKKTGWLGAVVSFSWVEKLIGKTIFSESKIFFETFIALRDRILERCNLLSQFFKDDEVSVVAVGTAESTAELELAGLVEFLKSKEIRVQSLILNQIESAVPQVSCPSPELKEKWDALVGHQEVRALRAGEAVEKLRRLYEGHEILTLPMRYKAQGFEILRETANALLP